MNRERPKTVAISLVRTNGDGSHSIVTAEEVLTVLHNLGVVDQFPWKLCPHQETKPDPTGGVNDMIHHVTTCLVCGAVVAEKDESIYNDEYRRKQGLIP